MMSSPSVLWDANQGTDTPTASPQCAVWQLSSRCTFRTMLPSVVLTNKQTKTPQLFVILIFVSCFKSYAVFTKNKSIDQRENAIKRIVENYLKCFSGLKVEFDTLGYDIGRSWSDLFGSASQSLKDYWILEIVLIRKRWREKTKPEYWRNIKHYPHSAVTSFLFWN